MRRWLLRGVAAACGWGLVVGFAELTDRTPHLLTLGAAVVACLSVGWLSTDALDIGAAPEWSLYRSVPPERTFDPRFSRLSQELAEASDRVAASRAVRDSLSAVADRLLIDVYDVDRADDPAVAREILGEQVTSYLEQEPGLERVVFSPELFAVLDRLESL